MIPKSTSRRINIPLVNGWKRSSTRAQGKALFGAGQLRDGKAGVTQRGGPGAAPTGGALPLLILRFVAREREGARDEFPRGGETGETAQRDGLHEHVAEGRGFHGAGQHGDAEGVGRELVEQHVLAAAAHDVQPGELSGQLFQVLEHARVEQGQTFQHAANGRARACWSGRPVSRQNVAIFAA